MSMGVPSLPSKVTRKIAFRNRLETLLSQFPKFVLIGAEHVGSKQLQMIRQSLRGKAEILMGKNTLLRKVIRDNADKFPNLEGILPYLRGNTGLVFTNMEIYDVRKALLSIKVQRAAKAGSISPVDVALRAGDTRLEPTKTSFFQALGIASKINRGTIALEKEVPLLKAGQRVTLSQSTLLQMLGIKPFEYGVQPGMVYDCGNIYPSSVSDWQESNLFDSVFKAITNVAAISVEIGHPTQASVMFSMRAAMNDVLAVAMATGSPLPQLARGSASIGGDGVAAVHGDDDEHETAGDEEPGEAIFGLFGEEEEEDAPVPSSSKKKTGDDGDDDDDASSMPVGNIFGEMDDY